MTVLRAVVTAGGTSEPIDDVRVVTNLSSGRLGANIALSLADSGVRTTLITSGVVPDEAPRGLTIVRIRTTADLVKAIEDANVEPVDLFFMAAAVSDYAPAPSAGKLSSDADELVVRMDRAPKILPTLRDRCGPFAFLVGFKLLSGVPEAELLRVARSQNARNRLDATFANDQSRFADDRHPGFLVLASGVEIRLDGDKVSVARALVSRCLDRVDPARRRRLAPMPPPPRVDFADPHELTRARTVLKAALADSGIDPQVADDPAAVPLHADGSLVGLIVTGPGGESVPYVLPEHRGREIGDITAERLAELGRHVLAPVSHAPWWVERGWRVVDPTVGGAVRLEPPDQRTPELFGASVTLIHPATDRILLGRRRVEPALGHWSFPGGRAEPGETPEQTALRELHEETGIRFEPDRHPELRTLVHVTGRSGRLVQLTNFLWTLVEAPEPTLTDELEGRWFPLSEVAGLRPVVPGVRRVLRRWRSGGAATTGRSK